MPELDPFSLAAAIVDDAGVDMDSFLAAVVREQQAAGLRVRGLLMHRPGRGSGCAPAMFLRDIETGEEYLVSQPLGAASTGCRADPQGFARASQVFRHALDQTPDLVVCNRFGDLEAQRGGFTSELLQVMERGIPLLTSLAPRNVAVWQAFTGGTALLPPDAPQVAAWIRRALQARHPA